jgi:hypothetical protein
MKRLTFGIFVFAALVRLHGQGPASAPGNCDPLGPVKFVCGQFGPEDLVAVPGNRWLVASAYGAEGGLHLIDTKAASSTRIFPAASATDRLDRSAYADCPGPLQGDDRERFRTHGLYLKPGRGSVHTVYAVHHGARESVEIFDLDVAGGAPKATWRGCVVAPDPIGLNAVIALPDGGLAATNFDPRPAVAGRGTAFSKELIAGERNGEVWEWHAKSGWAKVPGSEAAGANGLEISNDGQWYYVAQWGNRSFMRLSRGKTPVQRQEIPLGFRVDNVRWAPDGTLLVAGQGEVPPPSGGRGAANGVNVGSSIIGRIDPKTMTYTAIVDVPTGPQINAATVALQIGDELWTGSFRGDRLARYPLAGLKGPIAAR